MKRPKDFFASGVGVIVVGLIIGCLAALLQKYGNPANMGVCVACFTRDIVGAFGFHRAGIVQYMRPEIPAFCLGAFVAALSFGEFRPRTGSSPIVRFILGMFAMIGALVFLGCPWRAMLRLAGGDWNAVLGIVGLIAGIGVGVLFLKGGFNLGRSYSARLLPGLAMPFIMIVLLVLAITYPAFGDEGKTALFKSVKGPGAAAAPWVVSMLVGLAIGFLAQRTRFCTVGGFRDAVLMGDFHLLSGVIAFLVAAFALNLVFKQFNPGFEGQPAAHTNHWLNLGGMALAGLSFTLAGGCPGRQVFLSGEGDGDAAVFVIGMMFGAAVSHNFMMVATQPTAPYIVVIGLVIVCIIGFMGRQMPARAR